MSGLHHSIESLVRFVRDHSPYYREVYRDLPVRVTSLADLPVLDQETFWSANTLSDNHLLTGSMRDGIVLKSGGTTGKPKFSVFSRDEWNEFTKAFAAKLALSALREGDRVANLFYVGDLYGSFIFTHKVLEECPTRVLQLPIAGVTAISTALKTILEYEATVVAGLPTTLAALLDAIEKGEIEKYRIRTFLFAGEPFQTDQRERILRIFPRATIQSIGYASNDAGLLGYTDASCGPNEFRCYDGDAVYEIIDDVTGDPIFEPGHEGRAVVTALKRSLMPIIRYPVGDRAQWIDPGGVKDRKFLLCGRSDEGARIASLTIRYDDIQLLLKKFSDRLLDFQFQLLVKHVEERDVLVIRIATRASSLVTRACEVEILRDIEGFHPTYLKFLEGGRVHPMRIEWGDSTILEVNSRTGKLKRVIDCRGM